MLGVLDLHEKACVSNMALFCICVLNSSGRVPWSRGERDLVAEMLRCVLPVIP